MDRNDLIDTGKGILVTRRGNTETRKMKSKSIDPKYSWLSNVRLFKKFFFSITH